jgi:hypothetical protein
MEKLIAQVRRVIVWPDREEELTKLEELLDEYIDKRIKDRLDREFDRGAYSRW